MALFRIPTSNTLPWYAFKMVLTGVSYNLSLRYNVRMQRWILDIKDAGDQPVLMGIPLLVFRDFLGQFQNLQVPPGFILCRDDTGNEAEPALGSFVTTHSIYYVDNS